jgi:tetratricopeptide (TPR) repeat protein
VRLLRRLGTRWPIVRARRFARAGDWGSAASTLEETVAGNRQPETLAELGRIRKRQQRRGESAEAYRLAADGYRAALALDESNQAYRVRLGGALERARDLDGARRVYEELLERDPETTDLDRLLLQAAVRRFPARRLYVRFVQAHLAEIRERAAAGGGRPGSAPRVWVYWAQGIANAPPVVRRCHQELMRHHAADEVVVLDDKLVPEYVEIPEVARRRTKGDRTKFSDVLRLELLSRYGGVWLDATCFVRRPLPDVLPKLLTSGFFAFRYRRARIASWLLASEPNHPVVALTREAQYVYWERFGRPFDYYLLHHLFESLYYVADEFRESFEPTPRRGARPSLRFARVMNQPYDAARYERILDRCFVHKLTYKIGRRHPEPGSMLAHLLEEAEPFS